MSERKVPVCVFCKRSEGVQFAIFNPRFKPFGTACVECEKTVTDEQVFSVLLTRYHEKG